MKLCYFGIYNPDFGRNKPYISGLRQNGIEVVECRDTSWGPIKYWRLWRKHAAIIASGGYDALIVGYPGHIMVPFAKHLSRKSVIFDALCTLYEGEVISRGKYRSNPIMKAWIRLIDRRAIHAADQILVETNVQKEYFIKQFSLSPDKVFRIFTGADEHIYREEQGISKRVKFTAVFRGRFLPEAGVKYIVQAAKLLEKSDVNIRIIGSGHEVAAISALIASLKPKNVEWIREHLPPDVLRRKSLECHVSLGQFEAHERLERTIPHKAFESLAMRMPYVTGRAQGVSELLTNGKDCLMTNLADPEDIAAKILKLKNEPQLAREIADAGRRLFDEKLTARKLAQDIIAAINA
ncbi:MAG: glycosyltransferase family 4 protein [Candidatus Paceibacterota bacterium]